MKEQVRYNVLRMLDPNDAPAAERFADQLRDIDPKDSKKLAELEASYAKVCRNMRLTDAS